MSVLVTGCAGFIGSHLTDRLLSEGYEVVGVDNFSNNYDPKIKEGNLGDALSSQNFMLIRDDILNFAKLSKIFKEKKINLVIHLAARTGVRSSIASPGDYACTNVLGTINLLKLAARNGVDKFIFGSSSSVYGQSKNLPFSEDDPCQNLVSPYGASKRSAEFFVTSFHHTYKIRSVILRFFTVYGPRGRPDMAPAIFTRAILSGQPVNQFGNGFSSRDYTFIDDIVDGIVKTLNAAFEFEIINLGSCHPITLADFIKAIEAAVGRAVKIKKLSRQMGDVEKTWANIEKAKKLLGWQPKTNLADGLIKYVEWYRHER